MRCFHYEEAVRFLVSPADCLWKKQHTVFLISQQPQISPRWESPRESRTNIVLPSAIPHISRNNQRRKHLGGSLQNIREPAHLRCFLWTCDIGADVFNSIQWYWKDLCMCQCYLQDLGATFILISEDSFESDKSHHFICAKDLYFLHKMRFCSGCKNENRIPTRWSSRLIFSFFSTRPDGRVVLMASLCCLQTHQLKNEWWISDALTWTVGVV